MIKIGSDEGNSGAIIRWGKHWDNGIWIRRWKYKKLWKRFKLRKNYIDLGILQIRWNN
jgi:hypothetical protein